MRNRLTSDVYGLAALCEASGATPSQIESWCRIGIVIPSKDSTGSGNPRRFEGDIPRIDAAEAVNLTGAGFRSRHIYRRFKVQRAALAKVPQARRTLERHKQYIATISELATLFGRGPGFDRWLQIQLRQVQWMERALTRDGDEAEPDTRPLHRNAAALTTTLLAE